MPKQAAKRDLILERLRLAQSLLEESDRLPGAEGYEYSGESFTHPRHAREGLCIYLLLTCFDLLGQERGHVQLLGWLKSKKEPYASEREAVRKNIAGDADPEECAIKMVEGYNQLYGVKPAFFRGVMSLPERARNKLFDSARLVVVSDYGGDPNTSYPSHSFEGPDDERERLITEFMYSRRNNYTHQLEPDFYASVPTGRGLAGPSHGASFRAFVTDGQLTFGASNEDRKQLGNDLYVFTPVGWPFALFDALYDALGVEFDLFSINVRFSVMLSDSKSGKIAQVQMALADLKNAKGIFNSIFPQSSD